MPDFTSISRNDQLFLGLGLLTFIFSFIDFAHVHVSGAPGFSGSVPGTSITAWHGIGTFAALLILVALVVGAVALFSPSTMQALPVSPRMAAVGLAALGFVFFLIRWVSLPSYDFLGVKAGFDLAWGGYVTLILNLAMIAFGYLGMKSVGESMPWQSSTPPAAPTV